MTSDKTKERILISHTSGHALWWYSDGSHRGVSQADVVMINNLIAKENETVSNPTPIKQDMPSSAKLAYTISKIEENLQSQNVTGSYWNDALNYLRQYQDTRSPTRHAQSDKTQKPDAVMPDEIYAARIAGKIHTSENRIKHFTLTEYKRVDKNASSISHEARAEALTERAALLACIVDLSVQLDLWTHEKSQALIRQADIIAIANKEMQNES